MRILILLFALSSAGCTSFWQHQREITAKHEVAQKYLTCRYVGSRIRRLPEECVGEKLPPRVREH